MYTYSKSVPQNTKIFILQATSFGSGFEPTSRLIQEKYTK